MSQLSSRARVELAKAALSRIGLESPELRPYQDEPAQMPSGTVGKDGYLRNGKGQYRRLLHMLHGRGLPCSMAGKCREQTAQCDRRKRLHKTCVGHFKRAL